jgi:hypothetical protein
MDPVTGLAALIPDYTDVSTQLVAVGGAIAGVVVTFVGIRWVLSMLKRG